MANWTVTAPTPTETLQAQIYAREAFLEGRVKSFWGNWMGKGQNNVIQVDESFTQQPGSAINFSIVQDITSRGIAGSAIQSYHPYHDTNKRLEGQEASISTYSDSVLLDQLREAVITGGTLSEQRSSLDQRRYMKETLAYWVERIMIDEFIFKKLSGVTFTDKNGNTVGEAATTNSKVLYGGGKTARNQLTASDTFTLGLLQTAHTFAKVGDSSLWRMRPIPINGGKYFGCVLHNYQIDSLQRSEQWERIHRDASMRGPDNPLFTGAKGLYNNVLIYEHDKVVTGSDAGPGGDEPYASAIFFGLQAGLWAQAQPAPNWVEKTFDYMDMPGIATGMVFGFDRAKFNSKDFGVIKIETSARPPA